MTQKANLKELYVNRPRLFGLLLLALLPVPAALAGKDNCGSKLPVCSTETINGNCLVNIDPNYPITMPTFSMRPGCHITVKVLHPFSFQSLTLDPGVAQAMQGTDQAAALLPSAVSNAKNLVIGTHFMNMVSEEIAIPMFLENTPGEPAAVQHVKDELKQLDADLDTSTKTAKAGVLGFVGAAKIIYAQLKEIESSMPRPVKDSSNAIQRGAGVPMWTPNPWKVGCYARWRGLLFQELSGKPIPERIKDACPVDPDKTPEPLDVIGTAVKLIQRLPAVDPKAVPPPDPTNPSKDALFDISKFDTLSATVAQEISNEPDKDEQAELQAELDRLQARKHRIIVFLAAASTNFAKVITDLQTFDVNIAEAGGGDVPDTILGEIADPTSGDTTIAPYNALGRQITYTVNAVNQVATPTLGVPTSQQKQPVVTITAIYADPHFEVSSGAFVSTLPNRSFANYTDVSIVNGAPTPQDVRITESISRPELLPFVAANWRIGPDYTMPDKRRGAFYGSLAIALNPYNSMPEFAGGFSFSWRSFMFSPLYHLGHGVHLTQGETVGQIWCTYKTSASTGASSCSPIATPPAPTTKTFWTGSFGFGISIRVPTSFSGSNGSGSGGSAGKSQ